jgi:hypothetical protein
MSNSYSTLKVVMVAVIIVFVFISKVEKGNWFDQVQSNQEASVHIFF